MIAETNRQQFRSVLSTLATKTQEKIPALNGRVSKACKLVLQGDVALRADGTAQVGSLTDPARTYLVAHGACDCQDYDRAPEHLCAHRLSVGFLRKVQELLPPATSAAVGAQGPQEAVSTLPEAPASVNVRLTIGGHDCQLTLRGVSEDEVLTRLERILQRYPVATPVASPPPSVEPEPEKRYCPKHGVEMQLNHKDGRSWHSHKTDQGWCKGK